MSVFKRNWVSSHSGRHELNFEATLLIMDGEQDRTDVSRLHGKFFLKLPPHRLLHAFTGVDFSSRKFPKAAVILSFWAAAYQITASALDHGSYNGLHLWLGRVIRWRLVHGIGISARNGGVRGGPRFLS
jgi:hypothetical protein